MKTTEYRVGECIGLMDFLMKKMPDVSRTRVKEMLASQVYVDGKKVSQYNYPLQQGMVVSLRRKDFRERFTPQGLDIVYEDQHLVVVNKHNGLLSNSKNPTDTTVISILNKYFSFTHQRCFAHIVHRLDRDTSGLMVVSKSKQVSQIFEADWKGMVS